MEKNEYMITFLQNGKEETILRTETKEDLQKRIKCYKQHNIKIKKVVKKCVSIVWIDVKY